MSPSTQIKFENSPTESLADSFISTPGSHYPSLFSDTMDPHEVMTPQSYDDDSMFGGSVNGSTAGTPGPEKKQVKKRKSWGQQLPEPKTNLPPRKRAKTEDEKEQRRVERVLRNRRAAQSSRERKRQEVEALELQKQQIERRNADLEMQLADMHAKNLHLQQQLELATGGNMTVFKGSNAPSPAQYTSDPSPITFSQGLFESRDSFQRSSMSTLDSPTTLRTVNPQSLSPEIRPVDPTNASSSDMTQHPAAMLCDLQCQSEEQRPWMRSTPISTEAITQVMALTLLTFGGAFLTSLNPLLQIMISLREGSPISPNPSVLRMIIWISTTTASLTTTSTSTSSSTTTKTTSQRPRFSLRICLLNRLLACSPNLARPLMDATMAAMRLASEQQLSTDCLTGAGSSDCRDENSPSWESLATLLWVTSRFEKTDGQTHPEGDAPMEVRQSTELEDILNRRDIKGLGSSFLGRDSAQKSLDGWRMEFNPGGH